MIQLVCCLVLLGCQAGDFDSVDSAVAAYRDRMLIDHAERSAAASATPRYARYVENLEPMSGVEQDGAAKEGLIAGLYDPEGKDRKPPSPADVLAQIPDPEQMEEMFGRRLSDLRQTNREELVISNYERVIGVALNHLRQFRRSTQYELSLFECIQRTLANSYRIRVESYNPAISAAQLVEAEAAFDAEFFLDANYANQDRAVATDFDTGQSDTRLGSMGLRQLLPTGMQVSTTVRHQRVFTDFPFQVINPVFTTTFVAELRQPLLRGFGLDVNRAQINIRRAERDIAVEQFIQQTRDTLRDVEAAYWSLVEARRNVAILAETVAYNRITYENTVARKPLDATEVEIQNSKSRWEQRVVELQETFRLVRDAEDNLKNLMNDPELPLSRSLEIIPIDDPLCVPLAVDQFADVRTALERRSEIRQARSSIDIARIQTHVAKNRTLPQFDVTVQYTVEGVEDSPNESIDRASSNRFRSYTVGINFAIPLGNRAAKAAERAARNRESQSVLQLQQVMDNIIFEVNRAVRLLLVRYAQVPTQLDAVDAAERNLRAFQARTQRIDPAYLDTELRTVENLNNTRSRLLQIVVQYTTALVDLERAKGTLLDYNHVKVLD